MAIIDPTTLSCHVFIGSEKRYFNGLPNSAYACGGYQDLKDVGRLMLQVYDKGTCLVPLLDENGKCIFMPEHAGLTFEKKTNAWKN